MGEKIKVMKCEKIYMKTWLDLHGRVKIIPTDQWYLDFANNLLEHVDSSSLYEYEPLQVKHKVALTFALYLEDCIADGGNWRQFMRWHKRNYERYLPFYTLTEDYVTDEINLEDIAFLLWTLESPTGDDFDGVANPFDQELLSFSSKIYELLDQKFEEAPVSSGLADEWLVNAEWLEKERTSLPAVSLDGGLQLPANVENFLKASKGASLMFFDSYDSLCHFFVHSLHWEDKEEALLPELKEFENFVLYGNSKGLLIAPDVAEYFAYENNTLYNFEVAEEEAYELFCEPGLCPFDLLKYGMLHQLLPDAQFPFDRGKELLHENWDFVSRWFLREYYEGD